MSTQDVLRRAAELHPEHEPPVAAKDVWSV